MDKQYGADTNILLRFANRDNPQNPLVRATSKKIARNGGKLFMLPQNGIEFWNVTTRPESKNGFGWTLAETEKQLRRLECIFRVLPDASDLYMVWKQIVIANGISGVQVHDARIVAAMQTHSPTHILTFNGRDFQRYANTVGITVVDPNQV